MPTKPKSLEQLLGRGRERERERREHRKASKPFYDSARWEALRVLVLAEEPACRECGEPASEVDHVIPRRLAPERELDRTNLQALCKPCHSRKTAKGK